MPKAAPKPVDTIFRRRSSALSLLQMAHKWRPFYGPTGRLLWEVPSEVPLTAGGKPRKGAPASYIVFVGPGPEPQGSCTCPDYTHPRAGRIIGACKHVISVRSAQRLYKAFARHMAALKAAGGSDATTTRPTSRGPRQGTAGAAAPGR